MITFNSTKARYRSLEEGTYKRYSQPIMYHVTVTTRFLHAIRFRNTKGLGSFEIIGSEAQAKAAKAMYRYLLTSKGSTNDTTLLAHAHRLMDSVVRCKNAAESPIGCLTDQVLCLAWMRPNGCFGMANPFTGLCAMSQHGFYNIATHSIRLMVEGHKRYFPTDGNATGGEGGFGEVGEIGGGDDEIDGHDAPGKFVLEAEGVDGDADFGIDNEDDEEEEEEAERLRLVDEELGEIHNEEETDDENDEDPGESAGEQI